MRTDRFDARTMQRDFHWAWYLAPIPFALALFGAIWLLPAAPEPAAMIAAQAQPLPTEPTAAGPAAREIPCEQAPEAQPEEQPPTF